MPKINLYTDETAPLYQLVNNKLCEDLFNSIHSYIKPSIPKYAYMKELKRKMIVNKLVLFQKWFLVYDDELLSML